MTLFKFSTITRSFFLVTVLLTGIFADVTFMAQDTTNLQRSARKIMLDGFLLEWNTQAARPWGSDTSWQWSAMATPEGVAGYLIAHRQVMAEGWTILFTGPMLQQPLVVSLPKDTARKDDRFRVDVLQDTGYCVVEWLLPWPGQSADAHKPVVVTLRAESDSGKVLPAVVMRSNKELKRNPAWGGVTGRVIIIGLLAMLYLYVQRKLKRQTVRKESPRQ